MATKGVQLSFPCADAEVIECFCIALELGWNFSFGKRRRAEEVGIIISCNCQLNLLDILIEKADAPKNLCKIFPKQAIISSCRQRI